MALRLKVFGFVLASIELDIPDAPDVRVGPVDRGVKGMSNWWVKRMNR